MSHILNLSNSVDKYTEQKHHLHNKSHHSDTDLESILLYMIKYSWKKVSLHSHCTSIVDIPGTTVMVLVVGFTNNSHRLPVYIDGQSQYGAFPFIRHVPPDKQYPTGQLAIKYQITFVCQSKFSVSIVFTSHIYITQFSCPSICAITICQRSIWQNSLLTNTMYTTRIWIT